MEHSLGSYPNATVLNYMHVGLIDSRTKRKRRIEGVKEERKVPHVDIYILKAAPIKIPHWHLSIIS